jgi:hypothetical protein
MNKEQADYLARVYPAAYALCLDGWTVDSAMNHIEGVCDRVLCTGEHGTA